MTQQKPVKQFTEEEKKLRAQIERKHGKTPEQLYEEREKRVREAIQLQEPDRVPVSLRMTYFPAKYTGIHKSTAYYDAAAWKAAIIKTTMDFEPDLYQCASGTTSGLVMEALDPPKLNGRGGLCLPIFLIRP